MNYFEPEVFICSLCGRKFSRKYNLQTHIFKVHLKSSVNVSSPLCTPGEFICSICSKKFNQKYTLKRHISKLHSSSRDNDVSFLSFPSMKEFEEWKENEEVKTMSRYVQRKGTEFNSSGKRIVFYCHRSGTYISKKKKQKRALKITGSQKIGNSCYAFMKINIDKLNGSVRVEYNQHHSKHEKEIRFQPVPKNVENDIVAKLEEGIPARTILDQLRHDYDNNDEFVLQKKYLLNRNHVYNIARRHGLLHLYRRHNIDAIGVLNENPVENEHDGTVEEIQDTIIVEQIPFETSLKNSSFFENLLEKYKFVCEKLATEKFDETTLHKCDSSINEVINLLSKNKTGSVNEEPVNKKAENHLRFARVRKKISKKPEEEETFGKPSLNLTQQIKDDLMGRNVPTYCYR